MTCLRSRLNEFAFVREVEVRFDSVKTEIFVVICYRSFAKRFVILVYLSLTIRYCQTTNCKEMSLF